MDVTEFAAQPALSADHEYFWQAPEAGQRAISASQRRQRMLVAGIGNVLRRDDGFGPAVVQALEEHPGLPAEVKLIEVGIGGISLVLELLEGYDALVILDAVDRQGQPGALYLLEPVIPDLASLLDPRAHDLGADMHQVGPARALIIAQALGVLPAAVRIIGCQPGETDEFSLELSRPVEQAVDFAAQMVLDMINSLELSENTKTK